jgi:hypothetical protein
MVVVAPIRLTIVSRLSRGPTPPVTADLGEQAVFELFHLLVPGSRWHTLIYFTVFYPSAVIPIGKRMDLMHWARRKYKRLKRSDQRARAWLKGVRKRAPGLFAHWELRY